MCGRTNRCSQGVLHNIWRDIDTKVCVENAVANEEASGAWRRTKKVRCCHHHHCLSALSIHLGLPPLVCCLTPIRLTRMGSIDGCLIEWNGGEHEWFVLWCYSLFNQNSRINARKIASGTSWWSKKDNWKNDFWRTRRSGWLDECIGWRRKWKIREMSVVVFVGIWLADGTHICVVEQMSHVLVLFGWILCPPRNGRLMQVGWMCVTDCWMPACKQIDAVSIGRCGNRKGQERRTRSDWRRWRPTWWPAAAQF